MSFNFDGMAADLTVVGHFLEFPVFNIKSDREFFKTKGALNFCHTPLK